MDGIRIPFVLDLPGGPDGQTAPERDPARRDDLRT
jgi:hypothetical protein